MNNNTTTTLSSISVRARKFCIFLTLYVTFSNAFFIPKPFSSAIALININSNKYSIAIESNILKAANKNAIVDNKVIGGGEFKTATAMELRYEALNHFFEDTTGMVISPTSGGVNNICDYVLTPSGKKYVLRIYNNGRDSVRVDFEHRVLDALMASGQQLSFSVPTTIPSKDDGKRHVVLSTGAEATLFEFIPGELPKKSRVREIGRASGELVTALGNISVDMVSPNPRFCDLFKAHHATTREIFFDEVKKPAFDATPSIREYTDLLCGEVVEIEEKIAYMQTLDLPIQLIHADLHYDNVLCDGERVSGLLDFEFSVHDWRGMLCSFIQCLIKLIIIPYLIACELAVSLSKYAGEPDAMSYFSDFAEGYATTAKLTEKEINCIPELIILRVLSNVVYFVGRAVAGEDGIESLTTRAEMYYKRIKWIKEHRDELIQVIVSKYLSI